MSESTPLRLRFDVFELDEGNARLSREGAAVPLPPKAFDVLCTLARKPGQLITKDALLDIVWGHQHVSESVLKTTISEIRAALQDDARQPRYVETASRRGYRFIGNAQAAAAATAATAAAQPFFEPSAPPPEAMRRMIGREAALAKLRDVWKQAYSGRRQLAWITGEAGIGKTTLIETFLSDIDPSAWIHGQCVEHHGAGEPYLPVLEALSIRSKRDPRFPDLMKKVAPTWLVQMPWLLSAEDREALQRETAGATQDRMVREMREMIDGYSMHQPLLLVTEDLHWSDPATLKLMEFFIKTKAPARILWLCSFRLAEVVSNDHPLKALRNELRAHKLVTELTLDSFSESEVADYVADRFPDVELNEPFIRSLHSHTEGLPLFLVNVIDDLLSQKVLKPDDAALPDEASVKALQVPESLAGIIERQLSRLPEELGQMLEAASISGIEFSPHTVANVMKRDVSWVIEQCDDLAGRQQWLNSVSVTRLPNGVLDARYAFRHALYRHVLYQRISTVSRARFHRRAAKSLELGLQVGAAVSPAEVASHFERGQDAASALRYYDMAVDITLRRFAPRDAMNLSEYALRLLPGVTDPAIRTPLELSLMAHRGVATAQVLGVGSPETRAAFERAAAVCETLPPSTMTGLVLHGCGLMNSIRGEFGPARAYGERVHEMAQELDDKVLWVSACHLLGQISVLQARFKEGLEWTERGLANYEDARMALEQSALIVDPGVTMRTMQSFALLGLGFPDKAVARIEEANARAERVGQPMARMLATWHLAAVEMRLGHPQRTAELSAALERIVVENSLGHGYGPSRWMRGWAEAHLGSPQEGHRLIREGYDHHAALGMHAGCTEVLHAAAEALTLAGEWAKARQQVEEAVALAQRIGERVFLVAILLQKGRIEQHEGDTAVARKTMHEALDEARAQQSPWLELMALVTLCEMKLASKEERAALKQVRGKVEGGADTDLVKRADALLQ